MINYSAMFRAYAYSMNPDVDFLSISALEARFSLDFEIRFKHVYLFSEIVLRRKI